LGSPPRPPDLFPLAALSHKQLIELARELQEREQVDRYINSLETVSLRLKE
jgi:hypothetical protein